MGGIDYDGFVRLIIACLGHFTKGNSEKSIHGFFRDEKQKM
jgi:hypothetical protein